MANAVRGEVAFDVAGLSYVLRWSANAMCEIEEATGKGVNTIARELAAWAPPTDGKGDPVPETPEQEAARADRVRMSLVRVVFWAMLRERQPSISINAAGDLIQQVGGMSDAMALISQAFERGAAPETKGTRPPEREMIARDGDNS